jgi:uracil-DNA glycosylase
MAIELDARQRAMLQEMGVHVWLPGTDFAVATAPDAGPAAVPTASRPASRMESPPRAPAASPVPEATAPPPVPLPMQSLLSTDWAALQQAAASCQACGLCAGRRNTTLLPAAGSADWMVVGDPPDEDEDAAAHPFAGPSGVLLDNMLAALGLRRSHRAEGVAGDGGASVGRPATLAYVTNVVKCRPPHGALVQAADLAQCAAYLQREIALVQPKMILAMGRFANQLLLGETPELANQPLGKLRGVVRQYRGIAVVPTYHPKALMRNSADKAKAWADLCLAADALDTLRQASV